MEGSGAIAKNGMKSKPYIKNFNPGADISFKPLPITSASIKNQK